MRRQPAILIRSSQSAVKQNVNSWSAREESLLEPFGSMRAALSLPELADKCRCANPRISRIKPDLKRMPASEAVSGTFRGFQFALWLQNCVAANDGEDFHPRFQTTRAELFEQSTMDLRERVFHPPPTLTPSIGGPSKPDQSNGIV